MYHARSLVLLHLIITTAVLQAQAVPDQTKNPPSTLRTDQPMQREEVPVNVDREGRRSRETSAGNPEGVQHPGDVAFADTAWSVLLLDPDQRTRIRAMEARYAERLRALGPVGRTDPAYQRLWNERAHDIGDILTPTQYQRWKELNTNKQHAPASMPTAPQQGPVSPMPVQRADSSRDAMPVRRDTVPPPR